jgi:FkbH-like protein
MDISDLRHGIEERVSSGDVGGAQRLLRELWREEPTTSAAAFVVQQFDKLAPRLSLVPHRLAILRSFTVEPVAPLLRAAAFHAGIDLTIQLSDFNAYMQEAIDPGSRLYSFSPQTVILAIQTRDLVPFLWNVSPGASSEYLRTQADQAVSTLHQLVETLRRNTQANLIIHNFEQPASTCTGLLDSSLEVGQRSAITQINSMLHTLAREHSGVYVLDFNQLVARHGYYAWHDERKWLTVRLPIASQHLIDQAKEWLRFLHPLTGRIAKVLVVDLDDTLWKGVIGEDGLEGIRLGVEYPGAAFQEVQRALLDLHARGILLAICSKNNPDDAMEAIEKHPGMLLRPSHFAAVRINWQDKSQNLREIAAELNLGTDALAFLDDNPLERQQVRDDLPEVTVIDLPNDPTEFARSVRECPVFERLSLSQEDQQRGTIYRAQRGRQELERNVPSRADFCRSLQQEAEIVPMEKATLPRIAQLIGKTNQFNLTTRRYTEQQLLEMCGLPDWNCFSIAVRDRFGDNGLVGVAITQMKRGSDRPVCEIDTFILSCRVIGRMIETAFFWFLADYALSRGARYLQGWFLPTRKNIPAQDFYPTHGMEKKDETDRGSLWALDLTANQPVCPDCVSIRLKAEITR